MVRRIIIDKARGVDNFAEGIKCIGKVRVLLKFFICLWYVLLFNMDGSFVIK